MPIKSENKLRYGPDWTFISFAVRFFRAGGQCEWIDEHGIRCSRVHGEPIPNHENRKTILTTAHLDHNPENNEWSNLLALCQMHHLRYDARLHAEHAKETRMKGKK